MANGTPAGGDHEARGRGLIRQTRLEQGNHSAEVPRVYIDKGIVVKFSQLSLFSKATAAKEDGLSAPNLCVDPRVQPVSLRAKLDVHGNFAPDETKMVQQTDGAYVEATTSDPVSKKARSAM